MVQQEKADAPTPVHAESRALWRFLTAGTAAVAVTFGTIGYLTRDAAEKTLKEGEHHGKAVKVIDSPPPGPGTLRSDMIEGTKGILEKTGVPTPEVSTDTQSKVTVTGRETPQEVIDRAAKMTPEELIERSKKLLKEIEELDLPEQ